MKKPIGLLLLLAFPVLAFCGQFTITSPVGGEKWPSGFMRTITWTFSGMPTSTMVKLMLFRNGTKVGNIAENSSVGTNGGGSFNWTVGSYIGGTAAAEDGYEIRIRDMNNTYPMAQSPQTFSITPRFPLLAVETKSKVLVPIQHPIHSQGTVIIPLNAYLDLDSGHLITVVSGTDLWWSQNSIPPHQRVIIPNGGAKFKTLGVGAQYTYQSLRSEAYTYSDSLIPESDLPQNMVVGYLTGETRSGAFRVVGIGTNGSLSISWVTYE
jgi:hypothetical protein